MYGDVIYKGRFVWNPFKNEMNRKKHNISFEQASKVFDDPFNIEEYDEEDSSYEDRYYMTGFINDDYITVFFTMRDNLIRIFSARSADGDEEGAYNENIRRYLGTE
ncbi:hypothetical protein FACS189485_11320 [Spirochaetia bacterium]|nr:hypothetical protein FACS189485_11320 [Spirochaetia bacterium]